MYKYQKIINTRSNPAFTLVELLVVVAVIGVITSFSFVGYNEWRKNITITVIKNDLNSVSVLMENERNFSNEYPASIPIEFNASNGVNIGGGSSDGTSYCFTAVSSQYPSVYYNIDNTSKTAQPGLC